ncbi:hypothetical protein NBH19_08870 [Rhizobium sp. S95]|uniref:Uncharacterized protein n=1 Tax=Ciceribacter sichuanensis TaxID=2949647 RepID=A0AAJ1BY95_9HYPH|nr:MULTISPECIES: hypothetical protein [unclassified Ciceribacter]MCM2396189.1 hypothetical protein [Ciceribacter sp. S95]MCO5957660.1 hypothetical protein [Ciceribacter sp. S101]
MMTTKLYRVSDGVTEVNGGPVPRNRIVRLTVSQALFDLSLGRIVEKTKPKASKTTGDDDGGD